MSEPPLSSVNMEKATGISAETLRMMYVTMLRIRRFEEVAGELVAKQEIICPCHLYIVSDDRKR